MGARSAVAYKLTPDTESERPDPVFPNTRDGRSLAMGPAACDKRFDLVYRRPPTWLHLQQFLGLYSRLQSPKARAQAFDDFYGHPKTGPSPEHPEGQAESYGQCIPVPVYQSWLGYCEHEATRMVDAGLDAIVVSNGDRCALYVRPVAASEA